MERISRFRAGLFLALFAFVLVLFAGKLFEIQIIDTKGNTDNTQTYTTLTTVRAARGDILDRNGNVLVGNRASYDLVFNHYVANSYPNRNESLQRLVLKCREMNIPISDHLPITRERPFEYTLTEFTTSWQNNFQLYMVDCGWDSDITAPLLLEKMRERYNIPETWSDEDARAVVGFQYEFDLRGITNLPTYTFLEDVSDEHLSALLELNTPGLMVESSTVREYHTKYASHVLGYLGGMTDAQWQELKKKDYSMDAKVGQTGFELAFEEYLHGIDGTRVDVVNRNGAIVKQYYADARDEQGNVIGKKVPIAGNNIETTLDIKIQQVAEESLAELMHQLTNPQINITEDALDAQGAAVVVMDPRTGEILACASYPTYDLADLADTKIWAQINNDPLKPLFNRAFGAAYAPGSTYKMCTLIAAMENVYSGQAEGTEAGAPILRYGETIYDHGVYNKHAGFAPQCLFWTNAKASHGDIDGVQALCVSCNYFFYELGDRMRWEMMDDTAKSLGLGEPTGIEIPEVIGARNNPARKKEVYKTGADVNFGVGDRILGAIGQGENRFTPMQLCVYASTLANKGTRMKATFLSRVVSSDYRTLILENSPQIVSQSKWMPTTIETYWEGMKAVVTRAGGTAQKFFGGFEDQLPDVWPLKGEVTVYAKTGTAQHASGGSDHAAFICFAHRVEDTVPDIAIAIFGEKAAHGNWLCSVAEKVLMSYYELDAASEVTAFENQVS